MAHKAKILAGDVGATKTRLAVCTVEKDQLRFTAEETFSTPAYPNLEAILEEFLGSHPLRTSYACFGLAGPVSEGRVVPPNLAWASGVDRGSLARLLETESVLLLNDLEATGYGLRMLRPEQVVVLNRGRECTEAHAALIAAGTGLGEAILFWDGHEHRPSASEGGHCDFAPRTPLETDFFHYAFATLGRISYDRVVSGQGLHLLYRFLRDTGRAEEPGWLQEKIRTDDPAPVITEIALTQKVALCQMALDMFVGIYGAEAGNLALKALARAGIYVGGGIAPKILPKLREGNFMRAFIDKGRLSAVTAEIPVYIILDSKTALYGAAYFAARQAGWLADSSALRLAGVRRRSYEQ